MADRRLATYTTVTNPENLEVQTYPPGTEEADLPEWAAQRIDNESAWIAPRNPETPDDIPVQYTGEYAGHTVQELVDEARNRNIEGLTHARKAELISALEENDRARQSG